MRDDVSWLRLRLSLPSLKRELIIGSRLSSWCLESAARADVAAVLSGQSSTMLSDVGLMGLALSPLGPRRTAS